VVHYLLRKYCTVLTSVHSNDILYSIMHLCHYYVNTVQYIMYTVQYITVVHHYYVNTVQYITYSINTVQYITVIHYLLRKYCTVLMSVDSNDILYNNMYVIIM
jgi:hypothetical protein